MDEEMTHDGDEGDFVGFTGGAQALVEGFQDGVGAGGAECGHEEGTAHVEPAAADGADAAKGTAVAIKRGQTGERRDLVFGAAAEFGQRGQQGRSREVTDALDGDEDLHPDTQARCDLDELRDEAFEFFNLAVELAQMAA